MLAVALLWPAGWLVQESGLIDTYVARIIMLTGISITAAVSLQLINGISGQFSLGHAGFMAIGAYFAAYPSLNYSQNLTYPWGVAAFFVSVAIFVAMAAAGLYLLYRLIWLTRRTHALLPAILALILFVWAIFDFAQAPDTPGAIYVWSSAVEGLKELYRWLMAMLLPLGDQLPNVLSASSARGVSYLILLMGGGVLAAGAGLVVGIPSLRLRGDYLAIATLGFAEIVRVVIETSQPLGRALGMHVPRVGGFVWVYGIALITAVVIWRVAHSARGRAMLAVREDEIAASSIGIDPARSKVLAFVLGAFFAGMAGVALAHYEGHIAPAYFSFMRSVELVVIVTLAGAGSISGTILVAAILTWLPEQLRFFADYRMILYSLVLIAMMLTRPSGILAGRELFGRRRTKVAAEVKA